MAICRTLCKLSLSEEQKIVFFVPMLIEPDPAIRTIALEGLMYSQRNETIKLIIKALEDETSMVRKKAREILQWMAGQFENELAQEALRIDSTNFGIKEGEALPTIRTNFAKKFRTWEIVLPIENVEQRKAGSIYEEGWGIRFIFGKKEDVEYLEYVCGHRMLGGEPHIRLYENGHEENLESENLYSDPFNPEKEAEIKKQNELLRKELKEKGLSLHG